MYHICPLNSTLAAWSLRTLTWLSATHDPFPLYKYLPCILPLCLLLVPLLAFAMFLVACFPCRFLIVACLPFVTCVYPSPCHVSGSLLSLSLPFYLCICLALFGYWAKGDSRVRSYVSLGARIDSEGKELCVGLAGETVISTVKEKV